MSTRERDWGWVKKKGDRAWDLQKYIFNCHYEGQEKEVTEGSGHWPGKRARIRLPLRRLGLNPFTQNRQEETRRVYFARQRDQKEDPPHRKRGGGSILSGGGRYKSQIPRGQDKRKGVVRKKNAGPAVEMESRHKLGKKECGGGGTRAKGLIQG